MLFFNEIDLYFSAKKHYHLNPHIFIYIIELFGPPMTFLKFRICSLYLEIIKTYKTTSCVVAKPLVDFIKLYLQFMKHEIFLSRDIFK